LREWGKPVSEVFLISTGSLGMIRITIIDDSRQIRDGLRQLIDGSEGYLVTGAFSSMEEALPEVASDLTDVVLVDIGLPGISGIEGIRRLKHFHPTLHLLVLTVYGDDDRIFDALCAGACGYILKKTPPARLLESIAEVAAGGAPMSPEVARRVVEVFRTVRPPKSVDYHLTPHEIRILQLLLNGCNRKSAAAELGVSVHGVSFHLRQIYEKLQVHSRSEAVAKVLRDRLIK
jgi:DNA-binding NarL/FixJ family response regulator